MKAFVLPAVSFRADIGNPFSAYKVMSLQSTVDIKLMKWE
jgi:hypothetical protein